MEVEYFPEGGSITDYVCSIFDKKKLGVSVTRAIHYKKGIKKKYTEEDAWKLLRKKVKGIYTSMSHWNYWGRRLKVFILVCPMEIIEEES